MFCEITLVEYCIIFCWLNLRFYTRSHLQRWLAKSRISWLSDHVSPPKPRCGLDVTVSFWRFAVASSIVFLKFFWDRHDLDIFGIIYLPTRIRRNNNIVMVIRTNDLCVQPRMRQPQWTEKNPLFGVHISIPHHTQQFLPICGVGRCA